jgi:hypothetical protein
MGQATESETANLKIPFGLSLSKPRCEALPFDKLRANGVKLNLPESIVS